MSGYAGSPAGYLNPVAVDKIQHPDYDAKAAENSTMRLVQYLYPVLKNCSEMLEGLCKETDVQVPTDLKDNMEFLKKVYNTQIDWHHWLLSHGRSLLELAIITVRILPV